MSIWMRRRLESFWASNTYRPLGITLGALLLAMIVAAGVGAYPLPVPRILALILGQRAEGAEAAVFYNIRLPRILGEALVGAALAASGAAYQVTFRNPLVSPDILGVSAGAGLGAVTGIFFGLPVVMIQLLGFAGGLATVSLVVALTSGLALRQDALALVLTGLALGALAGAGISLVKVLADPENQLPAMTFWLLGSLAGIKFVDVSLALPAIAIGLVPLILLRWRIGVLAMGEDEARALGINAQRLRWGVILCATLMTSAAVSVAGTVGWIGLMVPHIARRLTGPRFDLLLPVASALGALTLVLVDTVARCMATTEVPLGILTAILGAPVFLLLVLRGRTGWS